jgi:hypothetical protein
MNERELQACRGRLDSATRPSVQAIGGATLDLATAERRAEGSER